MSRPADPTESRSLYPIYPTISKPNRHNRIVDSPYILQIANLHKPSEEGCIGLKLPWIPVSSKIDLVKTRRRIEDALRKSTSDEVLLDVAQKLGVEVAHLGTSTRPNFGPTQVRCVHQLKSGHAYIERSIWRNKKIVFFVTADPIFVCGYWGINARVANLRDTLTWNLSTKSVVPYESGDWARNYWIEFTDESQHLKNECCHHAHEA